MLAQDFQPQNRLEVAKDVVKQFVNGRRSDRIGIVAFSGEALTQVPLTTDYPVVQAAVDNLHAGQLEDGTAIGTAIATAANRLRDAPGQSRVMILLTDGVNNRGSIDPRTAAQAAGAFGIRIYAIGVGHRRHGAGAGGARAVRAALREAAGADRRRAAHRRRALDRRALLPRPRCGGAAAHHEQIDASSACRCTTRTYALHRAVPLAARARAAGASPPRWRCSRGGGRCHDAVLRHPVGPRGRAGCWPSLVAVLLVITFRKRRRRLAALGQQGIVARLIPASATRRPSAPRRPAFAGRGLRGVAFAGPRWGTERAMVRAGGVDLVLALDASLSMLATDERPNRLERMKQEVRRFLRCIAADRVGLIAFAGRSYVLTPLTVDDGALELFLDNLDPSVVGQAGSSLARAIRQGTDLFLTSRSGATARSSS